MKKYLASLICCKLRNNAAGLSHRVRALPQQLNRQLGANCSSLWRHLTSQVLILNLDIIKYQSFTSAAAQRRIAINLVQFRKSSNVIYIQQYFFVFLLKFFLRLQQGEFNSKTNQEKNKAQTSHNHIINNISSLKLLRMTFHAAGMYLHREMNLQHHSSCINLSHDARHTTRRVIPFSIAKPFFEAHSKMKVELYGLGERLEWLDGQLALGQDV
uniref:Uncharacterized protein n=2 Tax=Spironucleus salmonicida TaxID=348837 RepID=V6LNT9_9EUKA|eukprot:EST42399.1 Hypothetical protein SS50377_18043 [Spironucleus salmonicida]